MARVLVVATAGAGGDLPPLIAAALRLQDRGHEISWLGDRSVSALLAGLGMSCRVLPAELDLGPRLVAAIKQAMVSTGGDPAAAGPLVERALAEWAEAAAGPVVDMVAATRPDVLVTSLFGVEVVSAAGVDRPWAVINSTFYLGPAAVSRLEDDIAPRAVPLMRRYASLLDSADLVLHATDPVFDRSLALPAKHHYVGALGIWEPTPDAPAYLAEPGDPWVLVSVSSQQQDDVPLVDYALEALSARPVRALVTLGGAHDVEEIRQPPANAHVEQVVPHAAVLRHSRLLISHAGHGTVMKALHEGRPMVLVPWGRDQPGVAARAEELGAAVVVAREEATAATLGAAVDRVLDDSRMQAVAQEHAARLAQADPGAAAAELLETLI